ncbi:MAG: ABC transporter substrate-binding protein [Thaumarchaeota archaeon]|jgi:NitT/TauT family transport system substrate-binding protein|nr:ABC transporter substrate-binding protein [Nitrososphaerota archaeon]|tara:strand:+ start:32 stop:970 length:939 start_codon:yes stop_codon:yes gene_type:complete
MKKILISLIVLTFAFPIFAKDKVTLLMDWFPQGNQSGFWQAQLDNQYHDDLEITVKPGGPKVRTTIAVASGQVEFGLNGSDSVMMANSKGAKLRAIFVSLGHVPYNLVYHPNTGVKTIQDLNGRRFAVVMGITYWKWVKHKYGLDKVQEFPLTGDLGLFAKTPNMFQQGYSIFLPARMDAKGIPNAQFKVADLGYRPYSVLFTSEKLIKENPALVQAVVDRLSMSFHKSLVDPKPTRDLILSKSKKTTIAIHNNALRLMKRDFLPKDWSKIGCQDPNRWVELANQMKEVDVLPADFDPHQSYDTSFKRGCFM